MMATKPVWNGVAVGVVCVGMVFFGKWLSLQRCYISEAIHTASICLRSLDCFAVYLFAMTPSGLFQFSRFRQTFVEQTHRFARRILLGDAARRACALGFDIQRGNLAR